MTTGARCASRPTSSTSSMTSSTASSAKIHSWNETELRRLAEGAERCLYVGKGLTGAAVREHLDFGAVATVNAASLLVDQVDWSFWCDIPPDAERHALANCRRFLVPDQVHTGRLYWWRLAWERRRTAELGVFPEDRTWLYPYSYIWPLDRSIRRAVAHDRIPMCMTSPAGLYILARYLGYREIWCFGHDGGKGYAEGLPHSPGGPRAGHYNRFRWSMEVVAAELRCRLGTEVRFYDPSCPTWAGSARVRGTSPPGKSGQERPA
jgi:hypothetical protein